MLGDTLAIKYFNSQLKMVRCEYSYFLKLISLQYMSLETNNNVLAMSRSLAENPGSDPAMRTQLFETKHCSSNLQYETLHVPLTSIKRYYCEECFLQY